MKILLKVAKVLSLGIYAIGGVILLALLIPQIGLKVLNVATGSMSPAIPTGSLVLVHRVPYAQIKVGDVITYVNPRNAKQTITHRVVEKTIYQAVPALITKGDANSSNDELILGGNVVGKVMFHAPKIGSALSWIRTPIALVLLVFIPGLFIVIDEIQLLLSKLIEDDRHRREKPKDNDQNPPSEPPSEPEELAPVVRHRPAPRRRGIDGFSHRITLVVVAAFAVTPTFASITSTAKLTGNTISVTVATNANHPLINRILIGASGSPACLPQSQNINIGNTGPGSTNVANANFVCTSTITNNNNVNINNSNNQNSNTGNANNSGNTNGGSSTTGSAGNNNSNTTVVIINNNNSSAGATFIELSNPTALPVSLNGWRVADNSGSSQLLFGTIPAHGYFVIQVLAFQLTGAGDHVILQNKSSIKIDAVSWGTDSTQLSPAVAVFPAGMLLERKSAVVDTDSSTDWEFIPY